MMTIRKAGERGHANHGWLDSHHTFSFADYYDPQHMGYRGLRVINDDRVEGGQGFGPHPHRDMEIISYVLDGGLAHKDSTGTGAVIRPGDVQRMSAGTGVVHSEYNASEDDEVHFLQIWIIPTKRGIQPGYEQKAFSDADKRGKLRLIASQDGRDGSITIHSDASVYAGLFGKGERAELAVPGKRGAWIHVARGKVRVNGAELSEGDGAAIEGEPIRIDGIDGGEVLAFDLA
jgi:redox-sensitive bicupin YhaK (pirin superfamily)